MRIFAVRRDQAAADSVWNKLHEAESNKVKKAETKLTNIVALPQKNDRQRGYEISSHVPGND